MSNFSASATPGSRTVRCKGEEWAMGEDDTRVERVETKLTYQEAALEDLGNLVLDQGKRIERLEKELRLAMGRLKELEEGGLSPFSKNERPPHY